MKEKQRGAGAGGGQCNLNQIKLQLIEVVSSSAEAPIGTVLVRCLSVNSETLSVRHL